MGKRKPIAIIILALMLTMALSGIASASVYVSGYYRSNGTYVQPYYRSNPDGNFYNNYSTYGNVNPYTGSYGTERYPSYNYYSTPSYSSNYSRSYYGSSYYAGYDW